MSSCRATNANVSALVRERLSELTVAELRELLAEREKKAQASGKDVAP